MRDLVVQFNPCCVASEIKTFQEMCELIALEQFQNCVPDYIATDINKQKVKTPQAAEVLADEYIFTHKKTTFGKPQTVKPHHQFSEKTGKTFGVHREFSSSRPEYSAWRKRDSNT